MVALDRGGRAFCHLSLTIPPFKLYLWRKVYCDQVIKGPHEITQPGVPLALIIPQFGASHRIVVQFTVDKSE